MGYDRDLFHHTPDPQFICSLCDDVFEEPVQCPSGHIFCQTCITKWFSKSFHCPTDMESLELADFVFAKTRWVAQLEAEAMYCKYRQYGCSIPIKYRDYEGHIARCSFGSATLVHNRKITQMERQLKDLVGHVAVMDSNSHRMKVELASTKSELDKVKTEKNAIIDSLAKVVEDLTSKQSNASDSDLMRLNYEKLRKEQDEITSSITSLSDSFDQIKDLINIETNARVTVTGINSTQIKKLDSKLNMLFMGQPSTSGRNVEHVSNTGLEARTSALENAVTDLGIAQMAIKTLEQKTSNYFEKLSSLERDVIQLKAAQEEGSSTVMVNHEYAMSQLDTIKNELRSVREKIKLDTEENSNKMTTLEAKLLDDINDRLETLQLTQQFGAAAVSVEEMSQFRSEIEAIMMTLVVRSSRQTQDQAFPERTNVITLQNGQQVPMPSAAPRTSAPCPRGRQPLIRHESVPLNNAPQAASYRTAVSPRQSEPIVQPMVPSPYTSFSSFQTSEALLSDEDIGVPVRALNPRQETLVNLLYARQQVSPRVCQLLTVIDVTEIIRDCGHMEQLWVTLEKINTVLSRGNLVLFYRESNPLWLIASVMLVGPNGTVHATEKDELGAAFDERFKSRYRSLIAANRLMFYENEVVTDCLLTSDSKFDFICCRSPPSDQMMAKFRQSLSPNGKVFVTSSNTFLDFQRQ